MSDTLHEKISLAGKSLHHTLRIIAGLVILSPLAVTYLLLENKAFTEHSEYIYIIFFALVINMGALLIIGRIFNKFLMLSTRMKNAEAGDIEPVKLEEEVSELREISVSFNKIMQDFTSTSEDLKHRVFELFTLKELVETASKGLDIGVLLNSLLDKSMSVFNSRTGSIFLFEPDKNLFLVFDARGLEPGARKGSYLSLQDSLVRDVVAKRKPLLVKDIGSDARTAKTNDPKYRSPSFLSMPILCGSEIIAVLNVADKKSGLPFTDDDLSLLSAMIDQIGFALENAKLHTDVKKHSEKLELQTGELKRYQNELEELVEERTHKLEEVQEELIRKARLATLGQLTGTVSHELRNPLGTIRNSLDTLETRVQGHNLGVDNILERMDRNISRCDKIIDELLEYSRTRPLNLQTTAVDSWLGQILAEQDIPKNVKLISRLTSGVNTQLDQERFRQAIINVIDNACQAMLEQTRQDASSQKVHQLVSVQPEVVMPQPPQLILESQQSGDRLLVSISDNGHGIPSEVRPKVFEPLFSTKTYGVGLGLALVKQIMEQHIGGIDIESREGEGTKVILWLPLTGNKPVSVD